MLRTVGAVPRAAGDAIAAALEVPFVRIRLPWIVGCAAASAWALGFLTSRFDPHHTWGVIASVGYAAAALAALVAPKQRIGRAVAATALIGSVVVPLVVLLLGGQAQSEVGVVERSASELIASGSPYLPSPQQFFDYNPYLPGMAWFGLPHVVLDFLLGLTGVRGATARILGDPRLWFGTVFAVCLLLTWRLLRDPAEKRSPLVPVLVVLATPMVALPLCTGGVDLPLIGATCLGLAYSARGKPLRAALAITFASLLKWVAWPAAPVALVMLWRLYGPRAALRYGAVVATLTTAVIWPVARLDPQAVVQQVVQFPLGLASVAKSPAASPLPGHILAGLGSIGRISTLTIMLVGILTVAAWFWRRPPQTAVQGADRLAAALTVAFLFAPTGRFGYLALPAVLVLWPRVASGSLKAHLGQLRVFVTTSRYVHLRRRFEPSGPAGDSR